MTELEKAKRLLSEESCNNCIYKHREIVPVSMYCLKNPMEENDFAFCEHYFNSENIDDRAIDLFLFHRRLPPLITQKFVDELDCLVEQYR